MNAPLHREIPANILKADQTLSQVSAQWDNDIVRQISDYIAIPAKSPTFDSDWAQHGYIDTVIRNAAASKSSALKAARQCCSLRFPRPGQIPAKPC